MVVTTVGVVGATAALNGTLKGGNRHGGNSDNAGERCIRMVLMALLNP
jgi:hypothetical protein